jgi:endo-1,4-beta-xylanase
MKLKYYLPGAIVVVAIIGLAFKVNQSLKTSFKDQFLIGTALNSAYYSRLDMTSEQLIKTQFNSITAENAMKWEVIHPQPDVYDFKEADKFVLFGQEEEMSIIGHTLIWHSQLPDWVVSTSSRKDTAVILKRIKDHISTVMGRYKGRVKGWDVVNEALEENGTFRNSDYMRVLGESYIRKAFEMAAQADPKAELYYNDYNIELPAKREGAIRLIKNLKKKGVRIDGVGIQGHWGLNSPSIEDIETSIIEFSRLGVKVMITELDISVLPNSWDAQGADVSKNFEYNKTMDPYTNGLPESVQARLAERYREIFEVFSRHEDKISRVTFWGVQDGDSWLNNWPVKGRTNYPLLFDRDFKPKQAFYSVIKTVEK